MTSNIKKMYILLIVVLLKTCKRSRGEKSIIWNTLYTLQVRRTAGNVKVPRRFTLHKCDLSKKKFNRPLLVMLTQLNSTRRKAENWQSLRGESSAWWDVLSLESPFLTSRCLYIYLYGGILCSVKLHPWSVLWPYFPLEYFYFRGVFYGEVIHL